MLLVVEDNPLFSSCLARMLDRIHASYEIVDTGTEAIRRVLARGEDYALILLDMGLPDIHGADVARGIRAIDDPAKASVPIVVMGPEMPDLPPDDLVSLHFAGLLAKAFGAAELEHTIAACARPKPGERAGEGK